MEEIIKSHIERSKKNNKTPYDYKNELLNGEYLRQI